MGARKRERALRSKEEKKQLVFGSLKNCPSSPRKMRLVADMIRGQEVSKALQVLKHSNKHASMNIEKLLISVLNSWEQKNEGSNVEDANLIVSKIFVDSGRMLKRMKTAPQGRSHRIRKRSNHITIELDGKNTEVKSVKKEKDIKETKKVEDGSKD